MGEVSASTVVVLGIIAAICLIIGCIFGWLVSTLTGQKKEPSVSPDSAKKPGPPPAAVQNSLLSFKRNAEKGTLEVELGGKPISSPNQMSLDERAKMDALLKEGSAWLGPAQPSLTTPPAVQAVQRQTGPLNPDLVRPTADAPRPSMLGGMTNALADVINPGAGSAAGAQRGTLSIVQQIDEILQSKIAGTPLEATKVYMTEDAGKNVVVWVGNESFPGIGSLPEGQIKELIKSCVQEWERKQEKSLRRP